VEKSFELWPCNCSYYRYRILLYIWHNFGVIISVFCSTYHIIWICWTQTAVPKISIYQSNVFAVPLVCLWLPDISSLITSPVFELIINNYSVTISHWIFALGGKGYSFFHWFGQNGVFFSLSPLVHIKRDFERAVFKWKFSRMLVKKLFHFHFFFK